MLGKKKKENLLSLLMDMEVFVKVSEDDVEVFYTPESLQKSIDKDEDEDRNCYVLKRNLII